ncbi:hypothetical protein N4T57_06160 [Campylobacter hepaticus]|uniref:HP0268 domain-containing protein n=1 Tax=Campylobacter hepaticus TaxID=1813019 RepID=A0A6A7JTA0_9BACT|nr:HP0268 family nuclease [Campylobacter hepaticus]AXP08190.1 hypothetical protein A2J15_000225 [Campylobacter hepaticus]MCZ0772714.1 hypothetical protein [Campylobacter hepaticus]MCZ0774182.1 hypothetical protein [Campylobacter hepaticus]MCZ0775434.1 hypothetical protein [Campylobacter hepaticus]MDX2331720.1 hypothetical protein [Campylobacter hepaticus]
MELKLARTSISAKPKNIDLETIEDLLKKEGQKFFYFDKDNTHKQFIAFINHFKKKGLSIYHKTVKYGLDDNDFMYEVHIL